MIETRPISSPIAAVRQSIVRSRIVWVEAPAGFGKTTAVAEALSGREYVWCDLGTAPNEPGALIYCLMQALGRSTALLGKMLHVASRSADVSQMVDWIVPAFPTPDYILVFDDLHRVADDAISIRFLSALLNRCSDRMFVVMARPHPGLIRSEIAAEQDAVTVNEDALKLSDEDIADLLRRGGIYRPEYVGLLKQLTDGWPAAVHFAFEALRVNDRENAQSVGRGVAFARLAGRFLFELDAERSQMLHDLSAVGTFDSHLLAELGYDGDAITWLFSSATPIQVSGKEFRLHELFAEFLQATLGTHALADRPRVCRALSRTGRLWQAFDFSRKHAPELLRELVREHGSSLLESGRWQTFRASLRELPPNIRGNDPGVLIMRAWIESCEGNLARAESLLQRALESAECDEATRGLALRRLAELYNDVLSEKAIPASHEACAIGAPLERLNARILYGLALGMADRCEEGLTQLQLAVAEAEAQDDPDLIWDAYYNMAYVAGMGGDIEKSRRYFNLAHDAAVKNNNPRAIAVTYSRLLGPQTDEPWDRQVEAIAEIERISGQLEDPTMRIHALMVKYIMAAQRADSDWFDALDMESREFGWALDSLVHVQIARAMRLAWSGNFGAASELIRTAPVTTLSPAYERRWRSAIALFAALSGNDCLVDEALGLVSPSIAYKNCLLAMSYQIADLHAALAEIIRGSPIAAKRRIPQKPVGHTAALTKAVRLLSDLAVCNKEAVFCIACELAESGEEGMAALLMAWAKKSLSPPTCGALTPAEIAVLRLTDQGASAKTIAQETGRSIETVRNHIKSAIRKLGVSGKVQAAAAARRAGLIT